MRNFTMVLWILSVTTVLLHRYTDAQERPTSQSRGVLVEEVRNEHPDFFVRVDVDKPSRKYLRGEELRVTVVSAKSGYLYLLYCDAEGNMACLFPNAFGQDNKITAGRPIVIPQPVDTNADEGRGGFRLRIGPPFGKELLKAIVSLQPLDGEAVKKLMNASAPREQLAGVRGVTVESTATEKEWAEHHVEITTSNVDAFSEEEEISTHRPKRVGVFVGISNYQDEAIESHAAAEHNAAAMANVMRELGQIEQGWVLLNERATRQNLERVLRKSVAAATNPGDSVFIYWSGHGSQCADDGGDEADGFDEFLVPFDGRTGSLEAIRESMLLDDTFGRWVQELDGRQIVLVLDTCHSGGQATGAKSVNSSTEKFGFDFLNDELKRIKDIGQRDTAVLASSSSSQISFDRDDVLHSVLTHFLLAQLEAGSDQLSLAIAFESLKKDVQSYVESNNPGAVQTPQLYSNLSPDYLLRP